MTGWAFAEAAKMIAEQDRLAVNLALVTGMTTDEALDAGRASAEAANRTVIQELRRLYDQASQGGKS